MVLLVIYKVIHIETPILIASLLAKYPFKLKPSLWPQGTAP